MTRCAPLELTLAILKPDVTSRPLVEAAIHGHVLAAGLRYVRSRALTLSRTQAGDFYREHHGKFFYNRLVTFMSSGPISVHILAQHDAIGRWRALLGGTKVCRTVYKEPFSIRGRYGLSDTRNSVHGSDSPDTAQREIAFFFPEFDVTQWRKNEESYFREGKLEFDQSLQQHVPIQSK